MFFFSLHAIVHIRRNMLFTVVFVFLTESYKFNRTFQKYRLLIKGLDLSFVHFLLLVFECYFLLILDES